MAKIEIKTPQDWKKLEGWTIKQVELGINGTAPVLILTMFNPFDESTKVNIWPECAVELSTAIINGSRSISIRNALMTNSTDVE